MGVTESPEGRKGRVNSAGLRGCLGRDRRGEQKEGPNYSLGSEEINKNLPTGALDLWRFLAKEGTGQNSGGEKMNAGGRRQSSGGGGVACRTRAFGKGFIGGAREKKDRLALTGGRDGICQETRVLVCPRREVTHETVQLSAGGHQWATENAN